MIELEDEADVPGPPAGQLAFAHGGNQLVLHPDVALAGRIDPGDQVQERRLARAAGPHQAQELALGHFQREVLEDVDALAAAAEELVDVVDANDRARMRHEAGGCEVAFGRLAASQGELSSPARSSGDFPRSRRIFQNETMAVMSGFR